MFPLQGIEQNQVLKKTTLKLSCESVAIKAMYYKAKISHTHNRLFLSCIFVFFSCEEAYVFCQQLKPQLRGVFFLRFFGTNMQGTVERATNHMEHMPDRHLWLGIQQCC